MQAFDRFSELLDEVDLLLKETRSALEEADNSKTAIEKSQHLSRANTFARSGVVLLCGHFEGFLKNLLTEFASEINDAKIQPEFVPASLLETVLDTILQRCSSGSETHRKKLQDLVSGKASIEMDGKVFSNTGGNPKVDVIDKMLNKIGIVDAIEELSQRDFGVTTRAKKSQVDLSFTSRIKSILSARSLDISYANQIETEIIQLIEDKWAPKLIRREVGYVATIQELLEKRNLIAHGEGYPKVTDVELERLINEIKSLALGLDQMIHIQITILCNVATSKS
ncbi:MAG: hypothetical protein Kow00121_05960 [Elainellaceae cyanobacterium]